MEEIKTLTLSFIGTLGVLSAEVEVAQHDEVFHISIISPEEHSLVGRDNERFEAFSHILKRMIAKKHGEDKRVVVDVNGILKQKDNHLKQKASMMAERARAFKINVELEPMSSYERMIIHTHLEGETAIKTESIGEGKERRLIIKFIE